MRNMPEDKEEIGFKQSCLNQQRVILAGLGVNNIIVVQETSDITEQVAYYSTTTLEDLKRPPSSSLLVSPAPFSISEDRTKFHHASLPWYVIPGGDDFLGRMELYIHHTGLL